MEKKAIATVRLAPGRAGFYDPLSHVHLTVGRPRATIYSGTNCASLRRNVKAGVIRLEEGTLGEDVTSNAAEEMKPVYAEEISVPVKDVEEKVEEVKEEPKAEEIKKDEASVEESVEESIEEAEDSSETEVTEEESTEEAPKKKRRGRPSKAAK